MNGWVIWKPEECNGQWSVVCLENGVLVDIWDSYDSEEEANSGLRAMLLSEPVLWE